MSLIVSAKFHSTGGAPHHPSLMGSVFVTVSMSHFDAEWHKNGYPLFWHEDF